MIDGLKLTMKGDALKGRITDRIQHHEKRIQWYRRELARPAEDQTEEHPCLPDHICEHEIDVHTDQIEKLAMIREHLRDDESYLLGRRDLRFADLLPEEPI